ncbi:hypothetical protein C5688_13645 [Methylocystis sp. MitZ-2018]|nr:hypothetical protein C5688_13645 [Methylocystis sp. MitZ-2018]
MADEFTKGALGERRRIATILKDPEAVGRAALAQHLALETYMSPGEAQRALAAAPRGNRNRKPGEGIRGFPYSIRHE